MEYLSTLKWLCRRWCFGLPLLTLLACGCLNTTPKAPEVPDLPLLTSTKLAAPTPKPPPPSTEKAGQATRVAPAWDNRVDLGADPLKGGAPQPCLKGRVYLFGQDEAYPLTVPGMFMIDLYDHTPRNGQVNPKQLDFWMFHPEALEKLVKEDRFGKGYSLYLPWKNYSPELKSVALLVRFVPLKGHGESIVSPVEMIHLDHSVVVQYLSSRSGQPGQPQPGPTLPGPTLPPPQPLPGGLPGLMPRTVSGP
jgi:hypothetical protein